MTNYERIKNMSLEEMADVLDNDDIQCKPCDPKYCKGYTDGVSCTNHDKYCHAATVCWLESEAEETE